MEGSVHIRGMIALVVDLPSDPPSMASVLPTSEPSPKAPSDMAIELGIDPLLELAEQIRSKQTKVAVVGLGYVGLPLLIATGTSGFETLGFENAMDPDKIELLRSGHSYIVDVSDSEVASAEFGEFSSDPSILSRAEVLVICVPTPLTDRMPDLSMVRAAAEEIGRHLSPGRLVILESAGTDMTVLVLGETGTGKELVARAVHGQSERRERPLVKVNCSALPGELIESELFGHEKGAFTGAETGRQVGRFELADGGTIFLDEVGDLPLKLQAKLLRVLQEGEFERLGSGKTIKVDVRVIAATNRNLLEGMQKGKLSP